MVALLLGHEAVYLARYGDGSALDQQMTAGGHDGYWPVFLLLATAAAITLVGTAWRRRRRLLSQARALHVSTGPGRWSGLVTEWHAIARILLPSLLTLFLLQENIEGLLTEGKLVGLDPFLGSGALLSVPVLALVSAALACLGALVRWREAEIVARIAAALAARRRVPTTTRIPSLAWGLIADVCRHRWTLARRDLGRAPPPARPA